VLPRQLWPVHLSGFVRFEFAYDFVMALEQTSRQLQDDAERPT
jgi:hypothetical protein